MIGKELAEVHYVVVGGRMLAGAAALTNYGAEFPLVGRTQAGRSGG
jgi:hypothetical protein